MSAQEILKLIEEVDPSNKKALIEIDDLVGMYLTGKNRQEWRDYDYAVSDHGYPRHAFTTSRDALKSIRPEGWQWFIDTHWGTPYVKAYKVDEGDSIYSPALPTEELAELHAIIQAIKYERTCTPKEQ